MGYIFSKNKVSSRIEKIIPLVKNKSVLDVGCASNFTEIHESIVHHAKSVVGVDNNKSRIDTLKKGNDIICTDAVTMNLKKKFDVIVAGNIIHHISNVGEFLENMKRHLKKKGLMIITVPNVLSIKNLFRVLYKSRRPRNVVDYNEACLRNLLERHGFEITYVGYSNYPINSFKRRILDFFLNLKPVFSEVLIVVVRDGLRDNT